MKDNDSQEITEQQLNSLLERNAWWGGAWRTLAMKGESVKASYMLPLIFRSRCVAQQVDVDTADFAIDETLMMIDNFIHSGEHKVVANESTPDEIEGLELDSEIDDCFITEDLAEIYVKQRLYGQAIKTYRKLSLLDPKKSVYFAEIIERLEKTNN